MKREEGKEGLRPQVCLEAVSGVRGKPGVAFPVELITDPNMWPVTLRHVKKIK